MLCRVYRQKAKVGYVQLNPKDFQLLEFKKKAEELAFSRLVGAFYKKGITDGVEGDLVRAEPLLPGSDRFIVELDLALQKHGYSLK